ncbi:MAG: hypothetical protein J2O48_11285 [Solirubrobacterales bacterium]|nr:hypothetical protein [Solirubrobacterales bacterium]
MDKDGFGWLTEQLRNTPPAALGALSEADLRRLGDSVRKARKSQAEQIQVAAEQALEHVPRFLRGPVKKLVGG